MKNKPKLEIDSNGTKRWYLNDRFHKEDGPAIEYLNGDKFWYINNKLHRIDGPACEYINGRKLWYLNGKQVNKEDVLNFNITEIEYIKFVMSL